MKSRLQLRSYVALLVSLTAASAHLHGQAASAGAEPAQAKPRDILLEKAQVVEEETITLSPFEVTAADDNGYAAATSLAGNRISAELKDVGSAISVVTSQMLKDIGATSNESLLQYTTNTEVGNIYGNMANAGNGTQLDETSKFANPNQNTRVRGLAAADTTVDYFLTDMPWDSYNVDRVDFQRGPNAILFGLGSPAGIINAGTKVAGFKTKGSAEVRYSRFGSVRSTLDYNYVLLPKQLALRIDALLNKEKFQQEPTFQNDKRVFGALRYEPAFLNRGSAHTTFKVNFEQGNVRSNRPRTLTPNDAITPWFYTGTGTGYNADGTTSIYNNMNKTGFDARGLQDANIASIGANGRGQFVKNFNNSYPGVTTNGSVNPFWQPWLGGQFAMQYFGHPMAIFSSGDSPANTLVNWEPSTIRGIGPTGVVDKSIGGIPFSRMSGVTLYRDFSKKVNLPGAKFGLTKNLTLSDPSIFDFYNQLLEGPNKKEWQNFHRYNLNLGQTFFDGKAGIELVYDRQHFDNGQISMMNDKGQALFIDDIYYSADGSVNPNFGRPFIADSGASSNWANADREAFRATAFAMHNFDKGQRRNLLTRILGRHTLTGLYSQDTKKTSAYNFDHWSNDNAYKDFINGYGSGPATINSGARQPQPFIYLGGSLAGASSAAGAKIPNPSVEAVITGGSIRAFDSTWIATTVNPADPWMNPLYPTGHPFQVSTQSENPANYRGWINTPISIVNSEEGNRLKNTTNASLGKNKVESKAFTWQGYFWNGAIVGLFGHREDKASNWTYAAKRDLEGRAILDSSDFKLPAVPNIVQDNSNSASVVVHLNQFFKQKLPLNVSLFVNKSSNFQPLAGRIGGDGSLLAPPTGNTKDFGITFSTKDGKYSLKINKYETKVKNSNGTSGFNSFYLGSLFADYQKARNVFKFEVTDATNPNTYHAGDPTRWTYQPSSINQTQEQAVAAMNADVAAWDVLVKSVPTGFFTAWKIDVNQSQISDLKAITYATPSGFSVIEDNVSKGLEFELNAQPVKGLRLALNASKQQATRDNVGDPTFNDLANLINTALNTTAAGSLRNSSSSTATTALTNWNNNFWANWLSVKGQQGNAIPELRKWRANLIANYDFSRGMLKGVNVGIGYRWQDKIILGYKPTYWNASTNTETTPWLATAQKWDLKSPFYGPAETNIDFWVGYSHRISKNLNWRTQLNVRNAGKHNGLIPVTVQPDGTVAAWRIAPTQVWSLTNSIEF